MTRVRQVLRVLVFSLILGRAAAAQELRGSVRDSASRQPIPGAVLLLLDSAGLTLGRSITNDRGEFRIVFLPQLVRLRALRRGSTC